MADTHVAERGATVQRRIGHLSELVWHAGVFVVINAVFWLTDLALGRSGIQWAFWITAFWGFALAFHTLARFVGPLQLEEWRARQLLEDDWYPPER